MSKVIIEIDHVQSGQARAYADSVWEAFITMKNEGMLTDGAMFYYEINEQAVLNLTRQFVHGYAEKPEWHEARLEVCVPVGPTEEMKKIVHPKWQPKQGSRWRVLVRQPYLD